MAVAGRLEISVWRMVLAVSRISIVMNPDERAAENVETSSAKLAAVLASTDPDDRLKIVDILVRTLMTALSTDINTSIL